MAKETSTEPEILDANDNPIDLGPAVALAPAPQVLTPSMSTIPWQMADAKQRREATESRKLKPPDATSPPEAREQYGRAMYARQRITMPAKPDAVFLVECRGLSARVLAQNKDEAWAKFCDSNPVLRHPSPKLGSVKAC